MMKKPRAADWLRLYRLYLSAFPAAERKPFWMILNMYRRGVTDIWCMEHHGKFAGLAITINSPDVILLDYFAVSKTLRGQGVGTDVLKVLDQYYADKGFFVEIESTLVPSPEHAMRLRRKHFYLAAGLEQMHTTAKLFGVEMELLGNRCHLDFDQYRAFYRDNYNQWAADHIERI